MVSTLKLGRFIPVAVFVYSLAQSAAAATWYVATNGNDSADGTNWFTAKATIQAAIDVAISNDTILVSNGVYATGGRVVYGAITNRVAITNAITVQSVNGPDVTTIEGAIDPITTVGDAAVRCTYVGSNAVLSGFTLTNGSTRVVGNSAYEDYGGGAWCETSGILSNCILTGNSAERGGGGARGGTLNNCTLVGNSSLECYSHSGGGGAYQSTLNNCILAGNSALDSYGSYGGGAVESMLNHCILIGNSASSSGEAGGSGGGAYGSMLNNCTLASNSADYGGGSYQSTLNNCTSAFNRAGSGGGSCDDTLNNCTLIGNSVTNNGGGALASTLNNCTLIGNSASNFGGGFLGWVLPMAASNCIFTGNSASNGGGAYGGNLYNCILTSNSAISSGGAYWGDDTLDNCTVVDNSAEYGGGVCDESETGLTRPTVNNCIVYHNTAPSEPNYVNCTFNYSCTTPAPGGTGNITNDPQFVDAAASNYHLSANSPCIDRGNNAYAPGPTDLDGNPRIAYGVVDMGAYECQTPIGYWVWALAITNGLTNLDECATGDGYPNLLKYATGSSPANTDNLAQLSTGTTNGSLSVSFNRNTNAPDTVLIVEGADSLANDAIWNGIATNINGSWGDATNVAEIGSTNPVAVAVQDAVLATNRFLRLRVTRP